MFEIYLQLNSKSKLTIITTITTMIILMTTFQDNLDKPIPECQAILDFVAAGDKRSGGRDYQNSTCKAPALFNNFR